MLSACQDAQGDIPTRPLSQRSPLPHLCNPQHHCGFLCFWRHFHLSTVTRCQAEHFLYGRPTDPRRRHGTVWRRYWQGWESSGCRSPCQAPLQWQGPPPKAGRPKIAVVKDAAKAIADRVKQWTRPRGTKTTSERLHEIARAIAGAVLGTGYVEPLEARTDVVEHAAAVCGADVKTVTTIYDAMIDENEGRFGAVVKSIAEKKDGRLGGKNRILTCDALAQLDTLIQEELVKPKVGVTAAAVMDLVRVEMNLNISERTARNTLYTLGYQYGRLTKVVHLTSKRKQTIEKYIQDYDELLKREERGEVKLTYTDESYLHQHHKGHFGWMPKLGYMYVVVNGVRAETAGPGAAFQDNRDGDVAGGKGTRVIILHAITKDGLLCETDDRGNYMHQDKVWEPKVTPAETEEVANAGWLWRCKKQGVKDYHDNMNDEAYMWWIKNRCVPAFRKKYQTYDAASGKWTGPKMVLVLDNASYHHVVSEEGLDVKSMSREEIIAFCTENHIPALKVSTGGDPFDLTVEKMVKTKTQGGANMPELRDALKKYVKASEALKHLLLTNLERAAREFDFELLFTPPYNPKFQPIELFWRDSKNFAAYEWRCNRSALQAAKDLIDFWHGTEKSSRREKKVDQYSADKCNKLVLQARLAINEWIKYAGVKLSGELGDLKVDKDKAYIDDGTLGLAGIEDEADGTDGLDNGVPIDDADNLTLDDSSE